MSDYEEALMSRVEGDIHEDIAVKWFTLKGFKILTHQRTRGIDFQVELPDKRKRWYEVKGINLIYIHKHNKTLQVPYVQFQNIEKKPIDFYLIIVFDNFSSNHTFRLFEVSKEKMIKLMGDNTSTLSLYRLFSSIGGFSSIFTKVEDVNIKNKKFRRGAKIYE